ncbi:rhomboid family intramembrane serine protease [Cystobacter ferrugineus]|uniref:Rhomboid family intramembrane serine protease n=2 Tax=Cystobacter ferrugineus TaxID=83449 RepID=A0A1L9AZW3_9BACT|nr:rhomboid family intramembrane serine protease [Cystobacter ferrugineus]
MHRPPPVCAAVIGGSVALFVVDAVLSQGATLRGGLGPIFQWLALYGPLVQEGQYWRVLGCILTHGGPLHLAFNMWVAYSLGTAFERAIGSGRFLLLSLIAALGSSAFALLFNFEAVTVGASGMILGYGGAMLVTATREFRRDIIFWLVQVAVLSLIPGVSWAGHLGGFLFGLPVGVALRFGPRVFARAAPLLLAIAGAVVYITAHPERFRG